MKKFLGIIALSLLLSGNAYSDDLTDPKIIFEAIYKIKNGQKFNGKTGYVMRKNNEKNHSKFPIILPENSIPIISDYKSWWGASSIPGKRKDQHTGIDFLVTPNDPILAANDGTVVYAKNDKCAGNVITIKHPKIYLSYLHVGDFKVKKGDKVKRGQLIADAGFLVTTKCGGGIAHLHLQASRAGPCSSCTGSWKYLGKKESWTNAHKYWSGGKGKPECFIVGNEYPKKLITLPFQCNKF